MYLEGLEIILDFYFILCLLILFLGNFLLRFMGGGGYGLVEWREEIDDKLRFCM